MSEEDFNTLEQLLNASLEHTRPYISSQNYEDVKDYIEHGEYGVGWELLWYLVNDKGFPIPAELIKCGDMMGFDTSSS